MAKKRINPSAPPEPAVNVDWDKINAKYWATVDRWIEQGLDVPATRQRKAMLAKATEEEAREAGKRRAQRKPQGKGVGRGQPPLFNAEEIVRRYVDGEFVVDIAKDLGCIPQTVANYLKRAGVYVPYRDAGRQRRGPRLKDECDRGHDMREHGRPIYRLVNGIQRPNGRYCSECKRERERI